MADPRVTGEIVYSQDLRADGMLHAKLVRSPVAHGEIISMDASEVPENVVVLTPEDVEDLGRYGCQIKDQQVLPSDRVRFAGDIICAVAAETGEEAEAATRLIHVEYEELHAVFDEVEAVAEDAPLVHERINLSENAAAYFGIRPEQGTNVCHRFRVRHGDAENAFAEADVVVEETYRTTGATHAPMEPHAALAYWEDERLTVETGTQTPFNMRMDLAGIFGVEEGKVRIISRTMGGSFGAKTFVRIEAVAACLAKKAKRPVKVVLDRDEMWMTLNRHPATVRVKLGAKRDGTLVACEVEALANTGAYADCGPGVAQKMGFSAAGPYRIPNVKVDSRAVYTNLPPNGAYRGYGQMQSTWARERLMDRLAGELGISPLELRLKNLLEDGDTYCTGETMHDTHFRDLLLSAADSVGYTENPEGKGLCVMLKGMQTPSRAAISVEEHGDGTYTVHCATTEMGQGAKAAIRTMAAELLGVDAEKVACPDPDTDTSPYDTRTTSSRSTHMMSRALKVAVADLREKGGHGYGEVTDEGGLDPDTGQGVASSHWHQGAAAAEVEVDEETGRFRVTRLHAPIYAGKVVNRVAAEMQNEGSMIMGLGTTLYESNEFSEGQITNANLSDYNIVAMEDMPETFTHDLLGGEDDEVHGLGETALPPVPPAIGNALLSLGLDVTELPITAERVLDAVDVRDAATEPEPENIGERSSVHVENGHSANGGLLDGRRAKLLIGAAGVGAVGIVVYLISTGRKKG